MAYGTYSMQSAARRALERLGAPANPPTVFRPTDVPKVNRERIGAVNPAGSPSDMRVLRLLRSRGPFAGLNTPPPFVGPGEGPDLGMLLSHILRSSSYNPRSPYQY